MYSYIKTPLFLTLSIVLGCNDSAEHREPQTTHKLPHEWNGDPATLLSNDEIIELYSNVSCESLRHLIDYLDQVGNTDFFRGLSGEIRYQSEASIQQEGAWGHLDQYFNNDSNVIDGKLYLSRLDIPTRRFNLGFPKLDGSMIQTPEGKDLVEYFAIEFETELKLGPTEEEGWYELALLADDGVRLYYLDESGQEKLYLNSPYVHPTKMVCPHSNKRFVYLSPDETMPIRIQYFQGPRDHIALTLLWRKSGHPSDSSCNQQGNNMYFNYNNNPSTPNPAFNALLARGWSVIPDYAFRIPRHEYMNPCESPHVNDIINNYNPDTECDANSCGDLGI